MMDRPLLIALVSFLLIVVGIVILAVANGESCEDPMYIPTGKTVIYVCND